MIAMTNAMLMMLLNKVMLAEEMSISTPISIPSNNPTFIKTLPHRAQECRASSAYPMAMSTTPPPINRSPVDEASLKLASNVGKMFGEVKGCFIEIVPTPCLRVAADGIKEVREYCQYFYRF